MNVASFIEGCKKLGVEEVHSYHVYLWIIKQLNYILQICSAGEILEFTDPSRVITCIRGLLDTVNV